MGCWLVRLKNPTQLTLFEGRIQRLAIPWQASSLTDAQMGLRGEGTGLLRQQGAHAVILAQRAQNRLHLRLADRAFVFRGVRRMVTRAVPVRAVALLARECVKRLRLLLVLVLIRTAAVGRGIEKHFRSQRIHRAGEYQLERAQHRRKLTRLMFGKTMPADRIILLCVCGTDSGVYLRLRAICLCGLIEMRAGPVSGQGRECTNINRRN